MKKGRWNLESEERKVGLGAGSFFGLQKIQRRSRRINNFADPLKIILRSWSWRIFFFFLVCDIQVYTAKMPTMKKRKVTKEVATPVEDSDAQSSRSESPVVEKPSDTTDIDTTETTKTTASPKTFKDLGLIESLVEACDTLGYKKPTPIVSIPI